MARPPDSHSLIVVLFVNKNVLFLGMVSSLYVAGHKVEPAWYFVVAVPHISQQRGRGFSAEAPGLGGLKPGSLYRTWIRVVSHSRNTTDIFLSNLKHAHTNRIKIMADHTLHTLSYQIT